MSRDSVNIEIDQASLNNLNKQFAALDTNVQDASEKVVFKILTGIQSTAKLRLKGKGHIVTGRLWNSIHVKHRKFKNTRTNPESYSDDIGNTYQSDLKTVSLENDLEGAVGTNVLYGKYVEFKDSFLYWALKNFNIKQSIREMEKDIRFKK